MRPVLISLLLACAVALPLFAADAAPRLTEIDPRDLARALRSQTFTLVDCRGAETFAAGHVQGAIDGSLPAEQLDMFLPLDPEGWTLILYGENARAVAGKLAELGYARYHTWKGWRNIRGPEVQGGMDEMRDVGLDDPPTFAGRPYLIHVPEAMPEDADPKLLVWCHPSGGDPRPEFRFWKRSGILGDDTILLAPTAWDPTWAVAADGKWVHRLVARIREEHGIDAARVVFGGHSSGGFFTYLYALRNPEHYAHLVIAGAFDPTPELAYEEAGSDAPAITLYHAENDEVTPWKKMLASKAALEEAGYQVDLVEHDRGHGIGKKLIARMEEILDGL